MVDLEYWAIVLSFVLQVVVYLIHFLEVHVTLAAFWQHILACRAEVHAHVVNLCRVLAWSTAFLL